jgi:hypothetical protein
MWYGFSFLLGILGTAGFILWIARSFAEKERIRNERDALEANLEAQNERKKIEDTISKSDPSDNRLRLDKWARPVPRFPGNPSNSG